LQDNFLPQVPKTRADEWAAIDTKDEFGKDEEADEELYHRPVYTFRAEDIVNVLRQNAHQALEVKQEHANSSILDGAQTAAHKSASSRTPAKENNRKRCEDNRYKQLTSYRLPKIPHRHMQNYVYTAAVIKKLRSVTSLSPGGLGSRGTRPGLYC
jgi:hypothetical protein